MNFSKYSPLSEKYKIKANYQGIQLISIDTVNSTGTTRKAHSKHLSQLIDMQNLFNLPCNIYFLDTESKIIDSNLQTADSLHCSSPQEMFGHSMKSWTTQNWAECIFNHDKNTMKQGAINILEENWQDLHGPMISGISMKMPWRNPNNKLLGIFGITVFTNNSHSLRTIFEVISKIGFSGIPQSTSSLKKILASSELEGIYLCRRETDVYISLSEEKAQKKLPEHFKSHPKL